MPTPPRPIGVQRWSTRRVALLLLVLLVLIPAGIPLAWMFAQSSANPGGGSAVPGGSGSCTQIEELWLEAQSVPSASRIPCVRGLPADVRGALSVRDGESVLELSHGSLDINLDTSGQPQASAEAGAITIRLTATCAVPASGSGQTVAPDVRRFRLSGPDGTPEVVHIFPGGCVTFRPEPDMGPWESLLAQAERSVTFQARDDLREALRRRSQGRLRLDPDGAD